MVLLAHRLKFGQHLGVTHPMPGMALNIFRALQNLIYRTAPWDKFYYFLSFATFYSGENWGLQMLSSLLRLELITDGARIQAAWL